MFRTQLTLSARRCPVCVLLPKYRAGSALASSIRHTTNASRTAEMEYQPMFSMNYDGTLDTGLQAIQLSPYAEPLALSS